MRLQRRRFSEPSDVRTFPHGRVEVVELDDTVVGRMVYEPGWRWSVDVKPIAGTDSCQYHHLGVTTSGVLRVQMPDGAELEINPGDVFEIPPGHDAWVVGDEPWVSIDFEAMRTYGKSLDAPDERRLASILLTDIVDSTRRAAEVGVERWRHLVGDHTGRLRTRSTAIAGASSRRPATASWRNSMAPSARSGARSRSARQADHLTLRSGLAFTAAKSRSPMTTCAASPFIPRRGSCLSQAPARSSFRRP